MREEYLQPGAEIVESGFAVGGFDDAVFRAAAVAHAQHFALAAVFGQARPFVLAEFSLFRIFDHFSQRAVMNVADLKLRLNVVVTGIKIAVVLDDRDVAAGLAVNTKRVLHAEKRPDRFVEKLNEDLADIVVYPLVKDRV